MPNQYVLSKSEIKRLVPDLGAAFVTNRISIEGMKVDYMTRSEPSREGDSGWVFYGGGETQEYLDNPKNTAIFGVNTVANYDPDIIQYLTYPPGTEIERNKAGNLEVISQGIPRPEVILLPAVDRGVVEIAKKWSIRVSSLLLRRLDRESLVMWHPGFTIWINAYTELDSTIEEREQKILGMKSSDAEELTISVGDDFRKIRYHLAETANGQCQNAFYLSGLAEREEIHLAIYYDDDPMIDEVDRIWDSLEFQCS